MKTVKEIRTDFDPLDPADFSRKYPEHSSLCNLEWAIRQRRENGMLAEGCFVEIPYGKKMRCRVVPALLHQRLTGEKAIRPREDQLITMLVEQNNRLAALEARIAQICGTLEQVFDGR